MTTSKQLALTIVGNHRISTVELPGDLWFETMVFQVDELDRWHEVDLERYDTIYDAHTGHRIMVGKWRGILGIPQEDACFQCGETASSFIEDEDIHGETAERPICRSCRYDMFGREGEE